MGNYAFFDLFSMEIPYFYVTIVASTHQKSPLLQRHHGCYGVQMAFQCCHTQPTLIQIPHSYTIELALTPTCYQFLNWIYQDAACNRVTMTYQFKPPYCFPLVDGPNSDNTQLIPNDNRVFERENGCDTIILLLDVEFVVSEAE